MYRNIPHATIAHQTRTNHEHEAQIVAVHYEDETEFLFTDRGDELRFGIEVRDSLVAAWFSWACSSVHDFVPFSVHPVAEAELNFAFETLPNGLSAAVYCERRSRTKSKELGGSTPARKLFGTAIGEVKASQMLMRDISYFIKLVKVGARRDPMAI